MTLILSAVLGGLAYQVSDRQATQGTRIFDAAWNKTVVLRTTDALVSTAFAGDAFIEGRPTDEWAVEKMARSEVQGMVMSRPVSPVGLSRTIKRFTEALNAYAESHRAPRSRIHAAAVGWRAVGRRLRPCQLVLSNLENPGGPVSVRQRIRTVERRASLFADPPGWVSENRLERVFRELAVAGSPREREDLLIQLISEVSTTKAPVGPHAMCVRLPPSPKATIRFAPSEQHWLELRTDRGSYDLPAIHSPAILTPGPIMMPSVASGPFFDRMGDLELEWDFPPMPPAEAGDRSLLWAMGSVSRGRPKRRD